MTALEFHPIYTAPFDVLNLTQGLISILPLTSTF